MKVPTRQLCVAKLTFPCISFSARDAVDRSLPTISSKPGDRDVVRSDLVAADNNRR